VSALPTAGRLFERFPRFLRRHQLMRAWMAFTGEDPVQLVRIRGDSFGHADMSDGFLRLIVIDGDFEVEFFALADRLLERGGTFLDVGANYGLLSFGLAGRHGDRVGFHLFEPNPKLLGAIERTAKLYPSMRLTLNPVAIGEEDGAVRFFFDACQSGASHISEGEGDTEVRCLRIDTYLHERGIERVDMLKLDVEGYELHALRGAAEALKAKAIRAVYFEYFEKWLLRVGPPRELIEFLDQCGYETCFIRGNDVAARGGYTATIAAGVAGAGVRALPVRGHAMPPMTDLLAVPKESLAHGR